MGTSNNNTKVWYLRHLDLFLSLADDEVEHLARELDDHRIPAGAELLRDRRRERIYLIKTGAVRLKTGAVRLYATEQQQQVTLALLGPGRIFGLSTDFGDHNPTIGAATLEPSYVCFATLPKIIEQFGRHPQVMSKLTQALIEQIFNAETWVSRITTQAPRMRLASMLLALCDDFGEPVAGGQRIRFQLTQTDLARMINVTRETVSRLMTDFTRAGCLSRDGRLLVVHHRAALEKIAQGQDLA